MAKRNEYADKVVIVTGASSGFGRGTAVELAKRGASVVLAARSGDTLDEIARECEAAGGWWVHLRRCAQCGHVGCCDSSPAQHATAHAAASGHPVVQSFEPGEDWFWDYERGTGLTGPELAAPTARPAARSGA